MGGFGPNRPKQNMHSERAQRGDKEGHPKEHADISNINNWAPKKRARRNQRGKPEETPTKEQYTEQKITRKKEKSQTTNPTLRSEKGKQKRKNRRNNLNTPLKEKRLSSWSTGYEHWTLPAWYLTQWAKRKCSRGNKKDLLETKSAYQQYRKRASQDIVTTRWATTE